jgi:pimeloyl-ACP methyl ester carboxylesterase
MIFRSVTVRSLLLDTSAITTRAKLRLIADIFDFKLSTFFAAFLCLLFAGASGSAYAAIESRFASVNGTRYHYLSAGNPRAPLMLFLHGFPELSWSWREQLRHFSEDYHAVALDLKGYNLTDAPVGTEKYALDTLAADVVAFIKALGHKNAILVGHDWGGALSWVVASKFPTTLRRLVIINGSHPIQFFREYYTSSCQFEAAKYIREIRSGARSEETYARNDFAELRKLLFTKPSFDEDLKEKYLASWRRGLQAPLEYYKAMSMPPAALFRNPLPAHLNPIFQGYKIRSLPVLVIWGKKDIYLCPGVNRGLGKFVEKLTLREFPELSHWIVHEDPELVNQEINEFLSGPSR